MIICQKLEVSTHSLPKFSRTYLSKFYHKNGIKLRAIKVTKVLTEVQEYRKCQLARVAAAKMEELENDGYDILWLDEMMTTKSTISKREWCRKG